MNQKTTNTQASAEIGRKVLWNPQILEIECTVNLKQKEGKVWQALHIYEVCAHQSISPSFKSFVVSAPSSSHRTSRQYLCTVLDTFHGSVPTKSCPRKVSYTFNLCPSALVPCAGSCCCRRHCELGFPFSSILLIHSLLILSTWSVCFLFCRRFAPARCVSFTSS